MQIYKCRESSDYKTRLEVMLERNQRGHVNWALYAMPDNLTRSPHLSWPHVAPDIVPSRDTLCDLIRRARRRVGEGRPERGIRTDAVTRDFAVELGNCR